MGKVDFLRELIERDEDFLVLDGLDDAIIGILERCGEEGVVLYDRAKILKKLMERDGMTFEEALEWYGYNIVSAYMGIILLVLKCSDNICKEEMLIE